MSKSFLVPRSSAPVARTRDPAWREHATPFVYRHPELFRLLRVPADDDHSELRWTLDTPEDYRLISRIYEALGRDDFGWREALAVVEANPSWASLNDARRPEDRSAGERSGVSGSAPATRRHVVLRADASASVGTGHLVRSRTLAEALIARGWRATWPHATSPTHSPTELVRAGIAILALSSDSDRDRTGRDRSADRQRGRRWSSAITTVSTPTGSPACAGTSPAWP